MRALTTAACIMFLAVSAQAQCGAAPAVDPFQVTSCASLQECSTAFCGCVGAANTARDAKVCLATTSSAGCSTIETCLRTYTKCFVAVESQRCSANAVCAQTGDALHAAVLQAVVTSYAGSALQTSCRHHVCEVMNSSRLTCNFGTNASNVCQAPDASGDMTLQLRLPLTADIQDVIAGGPTTSFVVNGTVSTPPSDNFLRLVQAGGPPAAIMFSSSTNAYINVTAAPQLLNPPLETLSICLWIMPTATADSTVLAKAVDKNLDSFWSSYQRLRFQHPPNSDFAFQYALKWVGGRLCAYVGNHYVCTVQNISVGNGYHVCLVSSVSQISLFINGILETRSSRSGISEYDSSVTPLIIGAEQSGGNGAVSGYFTGAISDVRFYGSELAAAYIISLFMCTQYAPPQQSLSVYQGAEVNVTLYGHGMYPLTGVRLITSGTCANPPVKGGAVLANVYAAGTETMIVDVPGSAITSATSNTTVCFPLLTALASTDFPVDSGIRLQPVALTSFRPSGGTTISIANNAFPANVSVTGYNLRPQHYLTLAMDPKCEMIMIPPQSLQFTVSSDGTSASFMISEAPMNGAPTNLFVCWQPAGSDRGKAVGKAYNTGLILSIQAGPENLQIAVSTGIYHYGPNEYINGAYFGAANNVTSCARASYFQNATVVTVTMGVYSDYYILQSGTTLCSFLLGNMTAKYSPMDPAAPWWNGLSFPLYPADWNWLGGSPAGYPADGRTNLAVWGSLTPDNLGGYGSSEVGQNPSWNRAFTITARSIPKSNVYFNVLYPPYIIYPGYPFQVLVQLTDVYGNIHMGMTAPTFKLSCSIGGLTSITTFGGYDFNRGPVNIPIGSTFVCNVSTTQVTANSNFVSYVVNMMALPTGESSMAYLSPGGVVQTVLKLGTPTQGLVPLSDGNPPLQQDLLAAAGGEAAQQPRSGQSVQSNDLSGASYTWLAENNVQGNFGAGAPNNTVQYFAFAVYAPGDQAVIIDFQANPVGVVYLDGVLRSYTSGGNNAMSPPIAITSGWHQVIVKLVSNNQTTMNIAIAGYGLMTAMAMPNQVPMVSLPISATESVLGWTGGVGLATGNQLTFIGSFSATAAYTEYSVSVAPSVTGRALTLPLVTPVSKTGGAAITCTVTVAAGTSGRWQATISHNGNALPSATLPALIFIPPAPTVTGVTGACATDSSQCLSGTSVLTIAGTNFDSVQSSDMTVSLAAQGGAPSASCNILQVMPTQLTCQLQLAQGTTPASPWTGSYLVAVSVAADPSVNALSTGAIGTLSVGGRTGSPGFSTSTAIAPAPGPGPSGSTPTPSTGGAASDADGDKNDNTTLIIVVAVLAVLPIGASVGLIVTRMRSNSIRRNNEQFTPGAGGDDYLPKSEKGQVTCPFSDTSNWETTSTPKTDGPAFSSSMQPELSPRDIQG
jgi:hypothetical protein